MKMQPLLFSMALALGSLSLTGCGAKSGTAENGASYSTLDAAELNALVRSGKAVLIDVRTAEEFPEGHLAGAINIPLDRFNPKAVPAEEGKETILYCRSGNRSGQAAKAYVEATGQSMRHLGGGIVAWEAAGLPIQK